MTAEAQESLAEVEVAAPVEYRTLLEFQLSGPNGLPADAVIETAILQLPPFGTRPFKIDLVSLNALTSLSSELASQQPALGSLNVVPRLAGLEARANMSIDVTLLMAQAQQLGLTDFQLRILEELGFVVSARLERNDTTEPDLPSEGPQLTVTHY